MIYLTSTHPPIPVLYEDNHVLIVEKPVNVPSQADRTNDADMVSLLKQDLKVRYAKPGNVYLGLVHRLDRPVGGVMVFAKTSKAASRLSEAVRSRAFHKSYLAVIHGSPVSDSGTLRHYLRKDSRTNTVSVVQSGHKDAKEAILDYEVLERHTPLSLVHIRLHTGRPHQIRVQFAASGCPLYGDQKYGAALNKPGQQLALWSRQIAFDHPVTKEPVTFTSTPPMESPWSKWPTLQTAFN